MPDKLTKETFIERASVIHSNKYGYENVVYINNRSHVDINCPKHGIYPQTPKNHLRGMGCRECHKENSALRFKKNRFIQPAKTTENFILEASNTFQNEYSYEFVNYINSYTKVKIFCKIHGVFEQTPQIHLGGHGCPFCAKEKRSSFLKKMSQDNIVSTEDFIVKAKNVHGDRYDYSKCIYLSSKLEVEIICKKHGSFWQLPSNHTQRHGCPYCAKVCVSKISQKWLDYIGIPSDKKHREVTLKIDGKSFRVDGFDPQTNTIYEFHGDWWHGNPKLYNLEDIHPINKKTYGELLENTQKRSRILKSAGYKVESIWESEWQEIEKEQRK